MERSAHITEQNRDRVYAEIKEEVERQLKQSLRPEFLNRIDEVIVFHPLTPEDIGRIVDIQFSRIRDRAENQGIRLALDDAAKAFLARAGYDPVFGARPLKRLLQREISDRLAAGILDGNLQKGDTVRIGTKQNSLDFKVKRD
jgi:ATP-dependent Clp protease ATP-binding subunit ClpA